MGKVWDEMQSGRIEANTGPIEPTSEREWMNQKFNELVGEAVRVVIGERQDTYGSPAASFQQIAEFWEAYLKRRNPGPLTGKDVSRMMQLMKISRGATGADHRDNLVDKIGYILLEEVI